MSAGSGSIHAIARETHSPGARGNVTGSIHGRIRVTDPSMNSSSMALPLLPMDLVYYILNYADQSTLAICSLVSRAWLPIAQRNLFRSIYFRKGASRLRSFLQAIYRYPKLVQYIRRFTFRCSGPCRNDRDVLTPRLLSDVLSVLSHLEDLILTNFDWCLRLDSEETDINARDTSRCIDASPRALKSLTLANIRYSPDQKLAGIWGILSHFSSLEILRIGILPYKLCSISPPANTSHTLTVERLLLTGHSQFSLDWLPRGNLLRPPRSIYFQVGGLRTINAVGKYLRTAGSGVHHITMHFPRLHTMDRPLDNCADNLHIAKCSNLLSLHVGLTMSLLSSFQAAKATSSMSIDWTAVAAILRAVSHTTRQITITVRLLTIGGAQDCIQDFRAVNWVSLSKAVDRLVKLEKLDVRINFTPLDFNNEQNGPGSPGWFPNVKKIISEGFGTAYRRGILTVSGECKSEYIEELA